LPTTRPAVSISSLLPLALVSQAGVFDRGSEIATPGRDAFTASASMLHHASDGLLRSLQIHIYVSVTCVIFVVVGDFAASPLGLLGEKSLMINKHYSAKTMHLKKVMPSAAMPSQWNSLGQCRIHIPSMMRMRPT